MKDSIMTFRFSNDEIFWIGEQERTEAYRNMLSRWLSVLRKGMNPCTTIFNREAMHWVSNGQLATYPPAIMRGAVCYVSAWLGTLVGATPEDIESLITWLSEINKMEEGSGEGNQKGP